MGTIDAKNSAITLPSKIVFRDRAGHALNVQNGVHGNMTVHTCVIEFIVLRTSLNKENADAARRLVISC